MMKKIVVAVDGSESSKRAVHFAANYALNLDFELILFTVTQTNPFDADANFQFPEEKMKKLQQKISDERFGCYDAFLLKNKNVRKESVDSKNIVAALCEYLEGNTADMLVMGRTGTSTFQRLLGGSVSHGMLELSPIPVCIVP